MKIKPIIFILTMITPLLIGSCGQDPEKQDLDVSYLNDSIDPGDNFYRYANDGWMEAHPLPDDESRFGSFDLLAKETKKKVRDLVQDFARANPEQGTIEQKIGDFYSLAMDTQQIEAQGLTPIQDKITQIQNIQTREQILEQIHHFHQYSIGSLFRLGASADAKNSDMVIAQLAQGGLGMSDRDYYLNKDKRSKQIRSAYQDYVTTLFTLSGEDENKASEKAQTIMDMETRLAKASMTRLERRDPHKTYHKMGLSEVRDLCPDINWEGYFAGLNIATPEEINVRQPEFFKEVSQMLKEVPTDQWKTYLHWNLLNSSASYLSEDFVNAHFTFYGKTMQGQQEMKPRWRRVLDVTNRALGDAIGKKFVEEHFPPEAKKRMVNLVDNLKEAFARRIENLEWMGQETQSKALEKLEVMNVKIGYPDQWRDFSDLQIGSSSFLDNVMESRRFNRNYQLNKIGKPVDPDEWFFPPQTVNAYYAPSMNEICFPAGILQPPFFYMEGDDAINYGAIGGVIGHEMTHGFDDQGRQYDKEGNLNNWWTEEDAEKFNKRTKVLVKQYDKKTVLDTVHANGELTLGENIADLGGLSISYTAFHQAIADKEVPEKIDGYTPDQRFFLSWARVWAQNIRDEEILRRTKEDVHSLGLHRVNGPLVNIDAFYQAFNVTPDDELYLPEDKRAKIW
ncbi:MAG: M13 family metallopeptidase [Bacteroidales bacterium]|nr:M13 family metallopeptidase [Bacteroidales bacterium]